MFKCKKALVLSMMMLLAVTPLVAGCPPPPPEPVFPDSPITILVTWSPGGRTDVFNRAFAVALEEQLGVPVIVANKPGGGGMMGAKAFAAVRPDGYTIADFSISHHLSIFTRTPPFDPELYVPVAQTVDLPLALAVYAGSPWDTLEEFVAYVRAHPGKVKFGTSGAGASSHVLMMGFFQQYELEVLEIHYKGDGPALTAAAANEVDFVAVPMVAAKPLVDAGMLRVLGITSAERRPLYPELPTFREQGFDYVAGFWAGKFAVAGTPPERIAIWEAAIEAALEDPQFVEWAKKAYADIYFRPGAEFAKFIEEQIGKLEVLTEKLGLRIAP